MDLNYLYTRHQISLMNANGAACPEAKSAHLGLASLYARRIDAQRRHVGPGIGASPGR